MHTRLRRLVRRGLRGCVGDSLGLMYCATACSGFFWLNIMSKQFFAIFLLVDRSFAICVCIIVPRLCGVLVGF